MKSNSLNRLLIALVLASAPLVAVAQTWRVGVEAEPAFVPATNGYFRARGVDGSFAGALRADFSFRSDSRLGQLYHGLYQGIGVGLRSFTGSAAMGVPVSIFAYQGMPIVNISRRWSFGYEWQFGVAAGWRHSRPENPAVSTDVTAHMALGFKFNYTLTPRWIASAGVRATHFSNGNTSNPNAGVNSVGLSLGVTYIIGVDDSAPAPAPELEAEADRRRWSFDLMAYGAWRKRALMLGGTPMLCPGNFGVAGLQFAPLYRFNRYVAVGPALDLQYDESAGLASYWVEGTSGDDLKFYRPPFVRQLSAGVSAHAELTMPIFAVNVGLGYDLLSPRGEKRFYQSLALKVFATERIFLNVGYRLGRFQTPQNLMLGVGVRL